MIIQSETSREKPKQYQVNTNSEGDRFVGIKADTDKITVYFPLGYHLNEDNPDSLREDARNLFSILSEFMKKEKVLLDKTKDIPYRVDFPINAYLTVIRYYIANGYYSEQEATYSTRPMGNINWKHTIREQKCIISGGNIIYPQFTVKNNYQSYNNYLTQINRYCVEESFNKLGWLYLPNMPEPAGVHPPLKAAISILSDALGNNSNSNKDETRRLFKAMKDMLQFLEDPNSDKRFYFGVDDFTYIWQQLIDKAFGVDDVSEYFPHGFWYTYENGSSPYQSSALQEDSIMEYNGKLYILDAKFYKYGDTGRTPDLPPTDSIQKQLTYGDYVQKYKIDNSDGQHLFNAFLMPFDKNKEFFKTEEDFRNVAEAIGDWRKERDNSDQKLQYYERIQGILVDTRYLMYHYDDGSDRKKEKLANCIEEVKRRKCPV